MTRWLGDLSDWAAGLRFEDLPASVVDQARLVISDTLAAIAGGAAEPEMRALTARLADAGPASAIGAGRRMAPGTAAFLNGTAGTVLEADEGNRFARGHPAIHCVPAALAASEASARGGRELILAVVLGYEIGARLGIATALRPAMHPHGTWGAVGAAASAAKLARLDAAGFRECIGVASSLTLATSKKTMLEGGTVRNAYAGIANRMGLLAVDLVASGFVGERDGIASVFGEVSSDRFDPRAMVDGLGARWEIERNYFKRHACCRFNHGALDALDMLLAQSPVAAGEIERIEVATYAQAAELDDPAPRNTLAAKFSLPFAMATRLVTGGSGMASFSWDAVRNPAIRDLAVRVRVRHDPALTAMLPNLRPARMSVALRDGRVLHGAADANRGDDQAPYSRAELDEKFGELAGRVWSTVAARRVRAAIGCLECAPDLAELTQALGDVAPPG